MIDGRCTASRGKVNLTRHEDTRSTSVSEGGLDDTPLTSGQNARQTAQGSDGEAPGGWTRPST